MDRLNGKHLAMAVALAFAGTGAFAQGSDRASSDATDSAHANVQSSSGAVDSTTNEVFKYRQDFCGNGIHAPN